MVENPIVKNYMHSSSDNINRAAGKDRLNIKASVIYPEPEQTFWSRVIGLGYPTPEPPGFRWCTDRLKIMPMNKFVNERIKESGEIIILLGVRKGESLTRMKAITAREIEGKLLNMHNDIPNAYVYNEEIVGEYRESISDIISNTFVLNHTANGNTEILANTYFGGKHND